MRKSVFQKLFTVLLAAALVLTFTVPVSATGAPEEVYTPAEVTVPEKAPDDIPESAAEPTGEQLALIKDISVPEPTESVSETEAPVAPSDEAAFEEPLEELLPEETITEETVAEEPEEAPIDAVLEQEEIVYNTSALTLDNLPEYIVNNTLEKDVIAVGLAEEDMTELSSFTTINEDESRTLYLFGDPVKYIDKTDNSIRFIDNSILPVTSENGGLLAPTVTGYKNGGNSYDLLMPNRINMGVRFTSDDISVLMTPAVASAAQGNLKTHSFLGITEQVVEYRNVFGSGIHLQYTPVNSGVKENIILDSYSGVNTFNFTISTGDYYPLYTEGEAIPFIDPTTDDTAFILGQVDARDSYTGEETDGHFTLYNSLTLTEIRPGLYTLTVTVDEEFLTDPDTVYPVVVDPTITISNSYMQDTTVYSGHPDKQTYYSSSYNVVGYHGTTAGAGTAFIKATNLSGYNYILPGNISSATYHVYEGSGKTNSVLVRVGRPRYEWAQNTITYSNKPRTDPVSFLTINNSGWKSFDITDLVWDWMAYVDRNTGQSPTFGFSLEAVDATDSSLHFCSVNNNNYLPSITITYDTAGKTFDLESTYVRNGDVPFKAFGHLIHGTSPEFQINIAVSGTYYIQTLNSETQFGTGFASSAIIQLFDTYHDSVTLQSLAVPSNAFSYVSVYLLPGTYYLRVVNSSGVRTNIRCYVIMERSGQLSEPYIFYANMTKEFYKVSNATTQYNCLAYVVRDKTQWINLPSYEPTAINLLKSTYNCEDLDQPTNRCFVLYGKGNYVTTHIVIVEQNVVKSKMSEFELVRHSSINPYYKTSYGYPVDFFTDPFAS